MSKIITRRNILRGMFAAPAIIAIDNLMPVKAYSALIKPDLTEYKVVCNLPQIPGAKSFYYESTIEIELFRVTAKERKLSPEWKIEEPQVLQNVIDPNAVETLARMLEKYKPL